jgi:tetratricopeptide (TPR) repeat protein
MDRILHFSSKFGLRPCLGLSFAIIFLFSFGVTAQPGDEAFYLSRSAAALDRLDAQILKSPADPELLFQRAQIYLNWFVKYPAIVEHRGTVYATDPGAKALSDISRAIELEPRGPYFVALAKYYLAMFAHRENRRGEPTAAVGWQEIRRRYWEDELVKAAVDSFQKALANGRDSREKAHALSNLTEFYHSRALRTTSAVVSKIVLGEKQTALVYDDYDLAISLEKRKIEIFRPTSGGLSWLRDLYREKAMAAVGFEDLPLGIRTLGEGIRVITDLDGAHEDACYLYVRRGELHAMQKDLTAAMRDYTYAIDGDMANCLDVYEKRGDIYTALGNWAAAVRDYSAEMMLFQYSVRRLLAKRGNAYLRAGDAEKAATDLDQALEFSTCGPLFRLRAAARRLLNKNDLADEDEQKAAKYSIGRPNEQCAFR